MSANKFILNGEVKIDLSQDTATEEDVAKGKTFHKADGSVGVGTGGGAELNIAYGDTAPEDTSKLWAKTEAPNKVVVNPTKTYRDGENRVGTRTYDTDMPGNTAPAFYNGYFYFFGGSYYDRNICRYDPALGTYTTLGTKMNVGVHDCGTMVYGDYIYMFGGWSGSVAQNAIYKFKPSDETLVKIDATLTMPRHRLAYTLHKDKIYTFYRASVGSVVDDFTIDCIDPQTDTCSPVGLNHSVPINTAISYGDYIYLITNPYNVDTTSRIIRFDPINLSIETINELTYSSGATWFWYDEHTMAFIEKKTLHLYDVRTNTVTDVENAYTGDEIRQVQTCLHVGTALYGFETGARYWNILQFEQLVSLANGSLQLVSSATDNIFNLFKGAVDVSLGVLEAYKGDENDIGQSVEIALYKDGAWTTV